MNLVLKFRDRLFKVSRPLVLELEQLIAIIRTAFRGQHNDDGTHGAVTATSVDATIHTGTEVKIGNPPLTGYVRLVTGTATRPGYIDWHLPDGTRTGYLGWDTTNVELTLENGALFAIVGGATELTEMTEPAAPAANKARVYCKDNGAGKTQLCVRFATGAVQVIATEP